MTEEAAWVLGPFVFGAGVAIALGLFDIGTALREAFQRRAADDPGEDAVKEDG